MAKTPFFTVAHGCLVKAIALEKKGKSPEKSVVEEKKQEEPPKRVKLK
jgi:hypothetical protein